MSKQNSTKTVEPDEAVEPFEMVENDTEVETDTENDTDSTEVDEAPLPRPDNVPENMFNALIGMMSTFAEKVNTLAADARRVGTDPNKLVTDAIDTSTDPKIVEFREWHDALSKQLLEGERAIEAYVRDNLLSSDIADAESVTKAYKDALATFYAQVDVAKVMSNSVIDRTNVHRYGVPKIETVGAAKGTGTSKFRWSNIYVSLDTAGTQWRELEGPVDKDGKRGKATFTTLARKTPNDDIQSLQAAAIAANGGSKDFSNTAKVEFSVTIKENDKVVTRMVRCIPATKAKSAA